MEILARILLLNFRMAMGMKVYCALMVLLLAPFVLCASDSLESEIWMRRVIAQAVISEPADQEKLLEQITNSGTTSKTVRNLLLSWSKGEIILYEDSSGKKIPVISQDPESTDQSRVFIVETGQFLKGKDGTILTIDPTSAAEVDMDMSLRSKIQRTLDILSLSDSNWKVRAKTAFKLGSSQKVENLPALKSRLTLEKNADVRKSLQEAIALIQLEGTADPNQQAAAVATLARLNCIGAVDALNRLAENKTVPPRVAHAASQAVVSIREYLSIVNFFGTVFRGFSLGSILLIAALGLAITFGLMGVINMAHGEMIAVGAYATYVVENIFGGGLTLSPLGIRIELPGMHLSGWVFQTYFIFAIPVAFFAAAAMGLLLERLVIHFLYRRALESLLATWGISLVLQQALRLIFGANNVQVNSPSWLLGNFTVSDVVLGYNRIFVIVFAIVIVLGTWVLLARTPLGLFIRAVMQDRDMASCMGIKTQRVNMLTFAFGSGLAGLAGAFLSQIGNVGPSLGQSYIIDSFMTVVVGGVGNIAGTVLSAFGIGISDQILQQVFGSPVLGKITVLAIIILFLQWKPGGLFPTRSRNLEG